jgi:hypothetical protein
MTRARRRTGAPWLAGLLVALAIAGLWLVWTRAGRDAPSDGVADAARAVAADRIDPANEGRLVTIGGPLHALQPVRDAQLGVHADAVALLRAVEMLQWHETCASDACTYKLEWAPAPVDSRAFRDAAGHSNPGAFPFASERFLASELRLGAFGIDPALAVEGAPAVAHAVDAADLPPNLAATFRVYDGVLLAGAEAQVPTAGDLRVSYRIIAAGERRLTGVQEGNRLRAPHH